MKDGRKGKKLIKTENVIYVPLLLILGLISISSSFFHPPRGINNMDLAGPGSKSHPLKPMLYSIVGLKIVITKFNHRGSSPDLSLLFSRCLLPDKEQGGPRPTNRLWISSCLLYTSPSPRDRQKSRMPSSA